jgi:hypothetical protein
MTSAIASDSRAAVMVRFRLLLLIAILHLPHPTAVRLVTKILVFCAILVSPYYAIAENSEGCKNGGAKRPD